MQFQNTENTDLALRREAGWGPQLYYGPSVGYCSPFTAVQVEAQCMGTEPGRLLLKAEWGRAP